MYIYFVWNDNHALGLEFDKNVIKILPYTYLAQLFNIIFIIKVVLNDKITSFFLYINIAKFKSLLVSINILIYFVIFENKSYLIN